MGFLEGPGSASEDGGEFPRDLGDLWGESLRNLRDFFPVGWGEFLRDFVNLWGESFGNLGDFSLFGENSQRISGIYRVCKESLRNLRRILKESWCISLFGENS